MILSSTCNNRQINDIKRCLCHQISTSIFNDSFDFVGNLLDITPLLEFIFVRSLRVYFVNKILQEHCTISL